MIYLMHYQKIISFFLRRVCMKEFPKYYYYYELYFADSTSPTYSCILRLKTKIINAKDIEGARESAYPHGYLPYIGAHFFGYLTEEQYKELTK
jgi:hypothetical protein